jgi:hypothetical protein
MGVSNSEFDTAYAAVERLAEHLQTILAHVPFLADGDPALGPIEHTDGKTTDAVDFIAEASDAIRGELEYAEWAVATVKQQLSDARTDLAMADSSLRIVVGGKPLESAHDAILRCACLAAGFIKSMDGGEMDGLHGEPIRPVNIAELRKIIRPAAEQFISEPDIVQYEAVDALLAAAVEERNWAKRLATVATRELLIDTPLGAGGEPAGRSVDRKPIKPSEKTKKLISLYLDGERLIPRLKQQARQSSERATEKTISRLKNGEYDTGWLTKEQKRELNRLTS